MRVAIDKQCISPLTHFLFQFISPAYNCVFISVNHIIYNIGYFKQTGKNAVILIKSIFQIFLKNARKLNFIKKTHLK